MTCATRGARRWCGRSHFAAGGPGPDGDAAVPEGKSPEVIDRLASLAPLGRLGTPGDIAETVAFLAGPGRWVSGQVVHANGGAA